jgi:radical SAM superfamily enzyme YgiQ (UPF0313 family)
MPNTAYPFHNVSVLPNLAIASLAGNVDDDHEVQVADLVLVRRNFLRFLETRLSNHAPDLIGLSAMSFQAKTAKYITKYVKRVDPGIKIALGGYHATLMAEELKQDWKADLDFIIRGEGESTFNELLGTLESNRSDLTVINNLSFKKNGRFIHNPRGSLEDLLTLKHPKRSTRLLKKGFHNFGLKADVVEGSRGCLNNCKFCSMQKMYGRSFRKFSIDRILDDIENCKKEGAKSIAFTDDNINLDPEHFMSICDGIIESGFDDIHYSVQASINGLYNTPELLEKVVKSNFKTFFLGIENPNPRNLQLYGKHVKKMAKKSEVVVSYLRSHGIIIGGGLLLANENDSARDFFNVLDFAKKIELDLALFFSLTPYPKTKIRELMLEKNLVFNPDDFSQYDGFTANARTNYLSKEQVEMLLWVLYEEFYDLDWLKWNNIRRLYPRYFLKMLIHRFPRVLKQAIYEVAGSKNVRDFTQEILLFEKEFRDLKR